MKKKETVESKFDRNLDFSHRMNKFHGDLLTTYFRNGKREIKEIIPIDDLYKQKNGYGDLTVVFSSGSKHSVETKNDQIGFKSGYFFFEEYQSGWKSDGSSWVDPSWPFTDTSDFLSYLVTNGKDYRDPLFKVKKIYLFKYPAFRKWFKNNYMKYKKVTRYVKDRNYQKKKIVARLIPIKSLMIRKSLVCETNFE